MKDQLKLVILLNAVHNQYCVLAHNASAESAQDVVKANAEHGVPMILDQRSRHKTENAIDCRACRETVARAANLQPKPKFVRKLQ